MDSQTRMKAFFGAMRSIERHLTWPFTEVDRRRSAG
jgi:hypothetical protein